MKVYISSSDCFHPESDVIHSEEEEGIHPNVKTSRQEVQIRPVFELIRQEKREKN